MSVKQLRTMQIKQTFDICKKNLQISTLMLLILDPGKRNLTNSEDKDEMPHKVAFHHGLHCLLR